MLKRRALLPYMYLIAALGILFAAAPAWAHEDCPEPMEPTIEALHHCVMHAVEMGHIDQSGIATSLLAKLSAAQAAVDSGRTDTAINILNAFIHEVEAQSGIHIEAEHAAHMISHAEMVIEAL